MTAANIEDCGARPVSNTGEREIGLHTQEVFTNRTAEPGGVILC